MTAAATGAVEGSDRLLRIVEDSMRGGGELWVAVTGNSMAPTFRAGDRVLLVPGHARPRVLGVVLLRYRGRPILHRIVALRPGFVRTRGDACHADDPWVPAGELLARAVAVHGAGGVSALAPTLRFGWRGLLRYAGSVARVAPRLVWRRWRPDPDTGSRS